MAAEKGSAGEEELVSWLHMAWEVMMSSPFVLTAGSVKSSLRRLEMEMLKMPQLTARVGLSNTILTK